MVPSGTVTVFGDTAPAEASEDWNVTVCGTGVRVKLAVYVRSPNVQLSNAYVLCDVGYAGVAVTICPSENTSLLPSVTTDVPSHI